MRKIARITLHIMVDREAFEALEPRLDQAISLAGEVAAQLVEDRLYSVTKLEGEIKVERSTDLRP